MPFFASNFDDTISVTTKRAYLDTMVDIKYLILRIK